MVTRNWSIARNITDLSGAHAVNMRKCPFDPEEFAARLTGYDALLWAIVVRSHRDALGNAFDLEPPQRQGCQIEGRQFFLDGTYDAICDAIGLDFTIPLEGLEPLFELRARFRKLNNKARGR